MPPRKRKISEAVENVAEQTSPTRRYVAGKQPRSQEPLPIVDNRNPIDQEEELFKDEDWSIPKLNLYITYTLDDLVEAYKPIFKDFIKLPSRKFHPGYFYKIEQPISINEIKNRDYEYKDGEKQFLLDVELIRKNCFAYNDPDSLIVKNSMQAVNYVKNEVLKAKNITRNYLINDQVKERLLKHLDMLLESTEKKVAKVLGNPTDNLDDSIKLSEPFLELVNQEEFPDYYEVIHKPMSLTMIKSNLQLGYYSKIYDFYVDVQLLFQNAQVFNEPEALIYQDAEKLLKTFQHLMSDSFFPELKDSSERGEIKLEYDKIEYEQYLANAGHDEENGSDEDDNDDYDFNHYEGLGNGYNRALLPSDYLLGPSKSEEKGKNAKTEEMVSTDVPKFNVLKTSSYQSNTELLLAKEDEKPEPYVLIDNIQLSSSTAIYEQASRPLQGTLPSITQNWVDYYFDGKDLKDNNNKFVLTLPPIQTAITFRVNLNTKISEQTPAVFMVNKEKVNPTPTLSMENNETKPRYDVRLSEGLNCLDFSVQDLDQKKTERFKIWISILP
ncbi:HFL039Wp [Eremothecium sinecaudum]|uniref:HFL039Wp n=1 Tax=Eremothecium sinecaudum TaxID=45286 RepID=A0A0X8HUL2_9SACH|nr:HFL039Wp [Eremothecium sinecaudum]AMD21817.1 HFL039Wp [Eremothecium sinecaudum]